MSKYSVKVSGKNAANKDPKELNFDGGQTTFKFIKGYKILMTGKPAPGAINTILAPTVAIQHGLNYAPSYFVYAVSATGDLTSPTQNDLAVYTNNKEIGILGGTTFQYVVVLVGADDMDDIAT